MTFNQLKCFAEVALYRNFTEAANHLNIVQSGVSYNISELEKELNVKLFTRNKKKVELTYAGKQLLEKVYAIASLKRDVEIIAKKVADGCKGKLRIGYPFVPIVYRYRDTFARFREANPMIDIKYGSYSATEIAKQLEDHHLDIGFTRYSLIPHTKILNWAPLYKDPLCIVVGKSHPMCDKTVACVRDFEREILLLTSRYHDPGWFDLALGVCMHEECTPEVNDRCTDVYSVLMSVELGMGFTILPYCWKATLNNSLVFIPIAGEYRTEIGIAWHRDSDNESLNLFLKEFGVI